MDDVLITVWQPVSDAVGVPLDGISFILDAIDEASRRLRAKAAAGEPAEDFVTPAYLCDAALRMAILTFGDEHAAALKSWNLGSSELFGQAVQRLIEHGVVKRAETDLSSQFNGRFDYSAVEVGDEPYHYSYEALRRALARRDFQFHAADRKYFTLLSWGIAALVTIAIAFDSDPARSPMLSMSFLIVLYIVAFVRSEFQYPYRYSMRSLLIVMTVVALLLGVWSFIRP